MSMKIKFDVKYGRNTIELPINTGEKIYSDNSNGLSNLNNQHFTIINQIPTSQSVMTKMAWKKRLLTKCNKKDGIYDKSSQGVVYKANTWTAYIFDWLEYKPPLWVDGGYYALADDAKVEFFTAAVGDLLIFAEIDDPVPTSIAEFDALRNKYKDCGGIITGAEAYISYRPNGKPWKTNHIEIIKE